MSEQPRDEFTWIEEEKGLLDRRRVGAILQISPKAVGRLGIPSVAVLPHRGTRYAPKALADWRED
jgi:hypothetical protein